MMEPIPSIKFIDSYLSSSNATDHGSVGEKPKLKISVIGK